ncbi:hypothetical protein C8F04DRAFT_1261210 [Mycena alexandri]|uniref:Uncharacterized protein n=1 Tax=Mycena alexandri TaxID=1745969 RepID=A0AAD6X5Q1_9AGAR|nr:hypothetical protein C8F04DRAFT_1261210 [Mycena alexandri]
MLLPPFSVLIRHTAIGTAAPIRLLVTSLNPSDEEHQEECASIQASWRLRDRSAVKSYSAFLKIRGVMEAKLAASRAIASRRSAIWRFRDWLADRVYRPPTLAAATPPPLTVDSVAWATEHIWGVPPPGKWHPDAWESAVVWRRLGHGWALKDPAWDGVTRVAKTPGKRKRQRESRRQREEKEREFQARLAQIAREGGWADLSPLAAWWGDSDCTQ